MTRLRAGISNLARQRITFGTVLNVLGNRCTVKLSGSGAVLQGLTVIGPTPAVGQSVRVDYISGVPIVYTSEAPAAVAEEERLLTRPTSERLPEVPYVSDLLVTNADESVQVPGVTKMIFTGATVGDLSDGTVGITMLGGGGGGFSDYLAFSWEDGQVVDEYIIGTALSNSGAVSWPWLNGEQYLGYIDTNENGIYIAGVSAWHNESLSGAANKLWCQLVLGANEFYNWSAFTTGGIWGGQSWAGVSVVSMGYSTAGWDIIVSMGLEGANSIVPTRGNVWAAKIG